jgi:ketosteroid isomerase-like protein
MADSIQSFKNSSVARKHIVGENPLQSCHQRKMFNKKSKFLFLFLVIGAMAALTACSTASKVMATPTPDYSPDVRADMEKYNQCFSQMNAECMASSFVSHGTIYDTGLLHAKDSDGIRNYLDHSFSTNHINSLASTIDTITINGGVGVVLGTYDEKTTDAKGQSSEAKLQYVAEWIHQSNGQWLMNRLSTVILQ